MTLNEAAKACGLAKSTFFDRAKEFEQRERTEYRPADREHDAFDTEKDKSSK